MSARPCSGAKGTRTHPPALPARPVRMGPRASGPRRIGLRLLVGVSFPPMSVDVPVACTCGAVTGVVRGVTAASSRRLACMCDDCQVYARYLRRSGEILDTHGGTDLSYATQSRVSISTGRDHLRAVQLRETGMLRVYAGCCRTPVAHVPSPKIAFVGIPHLFMRCGAGPESRDAILGPLVRRFQGRYCRGEMPEGAHPGTPLGPWARAMMSVAWDTACHRERPSPFHETGSRAPVMVPTVLSASELEELRSHLEHLEAPIGARVRQGCS